MRTRRPASLRTLTHDCGHCPQRARASGTIWVCHCGSWVRRVLHIWCRWRSSIPMTCALRRRCSEPSPRRRPQISTEMGAPRRPCCASSASTAPRAPCTCCANIARRLRGCTGELARLSGTFPPLPAVPALPRRPAPWRPWPRRCCGTRPRPPCRLPRAPRCRTYCGFVLRRTRRSEPSGRRPCVPPRQRCRTSRRTLPCRPGPPGCSGRLPPRIRCGSPRARASGASRSTRRGWASGRRGCCWSAWPGRRGTRPVSPQVAAGADGASGPRAEGLRHSVYLPTG
mmetsp:Transcript_92941/g.300430  ORF Transcript_92941/g.300430 Transcript_92941/m.300430 type:complete len:284 (-) Transcript_92941:1-852(-)